MKMRFERLAVTVLVGCLAALVGVRMALATEVKLQEMPVQGKAAFGATHMLELSYEDFSGYVGSNITAVNTNSLPAGTLIEFKGMRLVTPFNSTLSAADATAVYCGLASDTDRFLSSTTIASDGTEVFWSAGNPFLLEQGNYISGGTNVVTNVVPTAHYTASGTNLLTTLRDNSLGCLGTNVAGKVQLFFRLGLPY